MAALITGSGVTAKAADDAPAWMRHQPDGITITDLAASADGQKIAFEYMDRKDGWGPFGVGVYDRKNGSMIRIPNPPEKQIRQPSFSHDGKRLLVTLGPLRGPIPLQIAEVELATLSIKLLTGDQDGSKTNPVYQPGTNNILFSREESSGSYFRGLSLLNPATGKERVIIDPKDGFHTIRRPSFVGENDIIFQAIAPYPMKLRMQVQDLVRGPYPVTYSLSFGESPKIYFPEAEAEASKNSKYYGAFESVTAAPSGVLSFMRASADASDDNAIIRELYQLSNGNEAQLTHFEKKLLLSTASSNGAVISFVGDYAEPKKFDIYVYDVKTGEVTTTNILQHIKNDQQFSLN